MIELNEATIEPHIPLIFTIKAKSKNRVYELKVRSASNVRRPTSVDQTCLLACPLLSNLPGACDVL